MSFGFVTNRRAEIVRLLEQMGSICVSDLTKRFGVSPLTIRRDLDKLAEEGIVTRSYGMASLSASHSSNTNYERERCKRAIAKKAAPLVHDGEIAFINTGTTALGILSYVQAENVTFVTNNGRALDAEHPGASTIILTGGEIRVPKWSMTGDFALTNIAQIRGDVCFMSCSGISAERGLTTNIAQEMRINKLMMENSKLRVVLADSSKIDSDSSFSYGEASLIDIFITDTYATDEQVKRLEAAGVNSIIRAEL